MQFEAADKPRRNKYFQYDNKSNLLILSATFLSNFESLPVKTSFKLSNRSLELLTAQLQTYQTFPRYYEAI